MTPEAVEKVKTIRDMVAALEADGFGSIRRVFRDLEPRETVAALDALLSPSPASAEVEGVVKRLQADAATIRSRLPSNYWVIGQMSADVLDQAATLLRHIAGRAEVAEGRVGELEAIIARVLSHDTASNALQRYGLTGLADCVDNAGHWYQSQSLDDTLSAARAALPPGKDLERLGPDGPSRGSPASREPSRGEG